MKDKNYYHRFASQLLRALLITGTGSAVTLLLHLHFDFSPQLTDKQYITELQAIMDAYSVELDRLDILAAATQPEFSGLRTFIKRVVEERIEKERQTPSKQEAMMDRVRIRGPPDGRLDEVLTSLIARFLLFSMFSEKESGSVTYERQVTSC